MKIYKVHQTSEATGRSVLILTTENEVYAKKFYAEENPAPGYDIELSVVFNSSVTLLEWK